MRSYFVEMFILLLFILFSTIDASSIPLLEDPKDIVINRFGSCALKDAGIIYGQYGKSIDPNIWYYSRILPTPTEEEEYAHINPSYSKVNKAFVAGIYNGTSRIEKFLRARKIWLFPPDHPRQNKSLCYSLLQAALQPSLLHQPYRESDKMKGQMYLVRASHVLVRGSGIFGSGCGYYQPIEACETGLKKIGRNWWTKCSRQLKKKGITFKDLYSQLSRNSSGVEEAKRTCIYRNATKDWQYVDKIFVMVAMWDTNFGHFLIDSLPRIVRFLPFLQANPDIKIQIRSYEQYFGNADFRLTFTQSFRNGLFRLLNISFDRVVHGPIVARQLYYPRPMKCSSPLNHPYELRLLSKILKKSALERLRHGKDLSELPTRLNVTLNGDVYLPFVGHKEGRLATEHGSIALRIILQVRYCANKTICHEAIRTWNDTDIVTIVNSFRVQFPTAQILTIKDSDSLATKCLECEIYEYSKADILIGLHGAGITNLIFMKPGSIVMEITNNFDARIMPLCGFNGPLSTVFGVHHYAYYTDLVGNVELDFNDLASEAKLFHKHVSKFSLANPLLL